MAEAALRMFPGILFRPREPVPPRFAHLVPHLEDNVGGFDRRELNRDPSRGLGVGRDGPGITNFARVGPDPWGGRIPRSPVPRPSPDDWAEPHNTRFALLPERPPQQHQGFLPPLSSSVKVQIVHDTAKFTVTHVFWNRSEAIKQGTYQFPLPLDATVTEFNCRIGTNRIIRGKVKGKEEARRDFDDDVRRGRTGGLVEQETAEIFTINLANIDANTKMRAELSFMCFLKHRTSNNRDVFTLTVPTFIAPRFGDVPQGVLVEYQFSHFLSFEADVLTTEELITVNSDTHNIRFVRGAGRRACQTWDDFVMQRDNVELNQKMGTVELEDARASLDRDMVITITTAQSDNNETPHACVEAHPHLENHKSLMLTLPSDYLLSGEGFAHDGEIVFVADRSGSMTDKIESLKSAMLFFIHGIPENRPFNIWCFGSRCEYMWPRSKNLTEQTRLEAIHYVQRNFAADMGGTDILPALKRIYESRGGYHTLDVVLLTDGAIWGPHEIIEYVKEKRLASEGLFRCFSLGIGYAVSHELVEGLAKAGGGYAEVITNVCGGGWEDRVVAVLKSALAGHVGSVEMRLEWRKEDSQELVQSPMSFKQSPANISAISPFIRNRIFLLFDSDVQTAELTSVNLKIRAPGGHVTTKRVLPKRLLEPDSTLHKLAVRALLGDLERGESWLHCCPDGAEDAAVRQEAIDLGMKWSLVSKWTSLYAVEEETDEPFDINIQFHLDEEEATHEDGLLQPRGTVNQNIGLTKGGAANKALDTATESDPSSDSEDDNNVESKHDDGSDGGSDDGDGNDNEPNGGADLAGQHGRSGAGSADGVHYGRHDEIPDDICDYGDSRMDNVDDATSDHTGAANEPEFESASLTSRSEIRRRSGHQELAAAELGRTTVSGLVEHHRGRVGDARFAPATSQTSWSRNRSSSRTRGVEVVGAVLTTYMRDDLQDAAAAAKIPDGVVKVKTLGRRPVGSRPTNYSVGQKDASPNRYNSIGVDSGSAHCTNLQNTRSAPSADNASAAAEHSLDEWESTASKEKPPLDRSSTYPWIVQPVASRSTKPVYQDHHVGTKSKVTKRGYAQTLETYTSSTARHQARRTSGAGSTSFSSRPELYSPGPRTMLPATSYAGRKGIPIAPCGDVGAAGPAPSAPSWTALGAGPRGPSRVTSYLTTTTTTTSSCLPPMASAPAYNPSASTFFMDSGRSVPKTEEELAAEGFVRGMLTFQRSDGSFHFRDDEELKSSLGLSFFGVVLALRQYLAGDKLLEQPRRLLAMAAAVVVLLEEQFPTCRALWVLMAGKTSEYVTRNARYGHTGAQLMDEARRNVKCIGPVMKEARDVLKRAEDASELTSAPMSP